MSFTNSTPNYGLPQYIGTDKPTYLGDQNTAYSKIDTQMKANADAAAAATSTANTAAATATAASTNATTALNTANSAASEAASATSAAATATSTANNAATDASAALRASAANTIENLAPAYDPTLTYSVGDLVTYVDENNSGKLYKCIVAVGTPEAFNINKWDDVTTSEVYENKSKLVSSVSTDGTTLTYGELFLSLFEGVNRDVTKEYLLVVERVNGTVIMCHESYISADDIVFSSTLGNDSNINITSYLANFNSNTAKINDWYMATTGNTVTDVSSTVISARTLKLYELSTI